MLQEQDASRGQSRGCISGPGFSSAFPWVPWHVLHEVLAHARARIGSRQRGEVIRFVEELLQREPNKGMVMPVCGEAEVREELSIPESGYKHWAPASYDKLNGASVSRSL